MNNLKIRVSSYSPVHDAPDETQTKNPSTASVGAVSEVEKEQKHL